MHIQIQFIREDSSYVYMYICVVCVCIPSFQAVSCKHTHTHTHTHIYPTLHNWFPLSPAPQQSLDTPTLAVSFRRPLSPRRGRRNSQPFAKISHLLCTWVT